MVPLFEARSAAGVADGLTVAVVAGGGWVCNWAGVRVWVGANVSVTVGVCAGVSVPGIAVAASAVDVAVRETITMGV